MPHHTSRLNITQLQNDGILPRYTVIYNIPGRWIGCAHEFFSSEAKADERYKELKEKAQVMRTYYDAHDRQWLGASLQYHLGKLEKEAAETAALPIAPPILRLIKEGERYEN